VSNNTLKLSISAPVSFSRQEAKAARRENAAGPKPCRVVLVRRFQGRSASTGHGFWRNAYQIGTSKKKMEMDMQFQKGTRNRRSGVGDPSNISTFTASQVHG
jgi:hypothetical protein